MAEAIAPIIITVASTAYSAYSSYRAGREEKKEYRRANGMRVEFEDNAGVLLNDKFDPTASLIKGPIAREAVERFKTVGKIASIVV